MGLIEIIGTEIIRILSFIMLQREKLSLLLILSLQLTAADVITFKGALLFVGITSLFFFMLPPFKTSLILYTYLSWSNIDSREDTF